MRAINPNKRSIVITRSTYVSSGKNSGHWLGDNRSEWPHLKYNLIGILEFNLFGIPYVSYFFLIYSLSKTKIVNKIDELRSEPTRVDSFPEQHQKCALVGCKWGLLILFLEITTANTKL
jgi:hypothetical protein